jgi:hypothetical protein
MYYNLDTCSMRIDTCECMSRPVTAASGVATITIIQMVTSASELSAFYLALPYQSITFTHMPVEIGAYRLKVPIPRFSIWCVNV